MSKNMEKNILKATVWSFLIVTPSLADIVSSSWCRAEPSVANGDDYLKFADSKRKACDAALSECQSQYQYCDVTGCGFWKDERSIYTNVCDLENFN